MSTTTIEPESLVTEPGTLVWRQHERVVIIARPHPIQAPTQSGWSVDLIDELNIARTVTIPFGDLDALLGFLRPLLPGLVVA